MNVSVKRREIPAGIQVAWRRSKWVSYVVDAAWFLLVLSLATIFIVPFIWMLSSSLKLQAQVFAFPPQWIPSPIAFQNYISAWTIQPTAVYFANTLTVVTLAVIGDVLSSSLTAFGFARLRFRGRDILFIVLLSTMMLPSHVTLIPHYLLFSAIGWVNTHAPLIVPYWFAFPLHVFLIRQFLMAISHEIDDSAKIDGASYFDIYARIAMPLAKPALGVVAMFSITQHWTEFTQPLIYLSSRNLFTLAMGLRAFQTDLGLQNIHILMAMSVMAVVPLVVLFFVGQRFFVQGVVLQGTH
jgi:multiple sugar transport system permease protein